MPVRAGWAGLHPSPALPTLASGRGGELEAALGPSELQTDGPGGVSRILAGRWAGSVAQGSQVFCHTQGTWVGRASG